MGMEGLAAMSPASGGIPRSGQPAAALLGCHCQIFGLCSRKARHIDCAIK